MKNLSIASIIEKNSLQSDEAWLVALKVYIRDPETGGIVDIVRVVRNTELTTIEGEPYEPFPFSIQLEQAANELPTLTVTIQDQTKIVQSYMQRYAGAVGSEVELKVVRAKTAEETDLDPELVEFFEITKSGVKDYAVSWTLGAENPLRQTFPSRRQNSDQCSFRYKDPDTCSYSGPEDYCDLTLNGPSGCRAKGNSKNYGGYPAIIVRG